ncbi:uncharacterized protein LOC100375583 [Saccoglossus kowalevskii]|uniref:Uncharacterized protein LOC100375583 n=1 Tax=Saccoglossus kowalevskii TaxID=10224 RepID=A0ABM0GTC8_SACKO|nr:PREDICTED: uncharacterized protein LOC100375583 [Saccoglossus kowalevskii]
MLVTIRRIFAVTISKQHENIGQLARAFSILTPANVTARKINENLEFRTRDVQHDEESSNAKDGEEFTSKPLVLLFSWMQAKQRHLEKFGDYYLTKGWDVLTVKIKPSQLLLPSKGSHIVAENVVNFVQHEDRQNQPLMIHAFSVGAYLYSEMLLKMQQLAESETQLHQFYQRVMGQIYDSGVDMEDIPEGLSKAVAKHPMMQLSFQKLIEGYMKVAWKMSVKYYAKASTNFHNIPVSAPALLIYSDNDPVSTPKLNEKIARKWRANHDNSITLKCFEGSHHVSHMYKYPDDYLDTLNKFVNNAWSAHNKKTIS